MGRLILILVILLPLSRYHFNIQTVQLNPENEIGIIIPTEDLYIIGIFSCRSPHSITKEAFAFLDSEGNIMDGLLSIRSKCEGLLIDEAIRQNQNAVFKNLDPSMRLLWTGGFYNLTINVKRVLRLTLTHTKQKRLFLMYQPVFFFVDKIFSLVFLNFFLEFLLLTNYLISTLSYIPGSIFRIGFFPTCLWGKVQGYGKKTAA